MNGVEKAVLASGNIANDENGKPRLLVLNLTGELEVGTYTVSLAKNTVYDVAGNGNAALTTTVTNQGTDVVAINPVVGFNIN